MQHACAEGIKTKQHAHKHTCMQCTNIITTQTQDQVMATPILEQLFLKELLAKYKCVICASLLNNPLLTECCGGHFCNDCLNKWLKSNKTCPHCRKKNFKFIESKPMKREINELEMNCGNQECEVVTTYSKFNKHLSECPYGIVDCSNKCREQFKRKDLEQHLEEECENRIIACDLCQTEGEYHEIVGVHTKVCPDVSIHCPNKCGAFNIKRKNVQSHRQKCKLEIVQCPFIEVGCNLSLTRQEMNLHEVSSLQDHLKLSMKTSATNYQKLKSEHEELQQKFDTVLLAVSKELSYQDKSRSQQGSILTTRRLDCIQTILTTMLLPNKDATLHFTKENGSIRTPSFRIHPGYKMYMRRGQVKFSVELVLERSNNDKFLPWPIPNIMTITYKTLSNRYYSGQALNKDSFAIPLCNYCTDVDLTYFEPGQNEKPILTLFCPVEDDLYAKICITKHECR